MPCLCFLCIFRRFFILQTKVNYTKQKMPYIILIILVIKCTETFLQTINTHMPLHNFFLTHKTVTKKTHTINVSYYEKTCCVEVQSGKFIKFFFSKFIMNHVKVSQASNLGDKNLTANGCRSSVCFSVNQRRTNKENLYFSDNSSSNVECRFSVKRSSERKKI